MASPCALVWLAKEPLQLSVHYEICRPGVGHYDWQYMAVCGVQPCEDIYPHLTELQTKDRLYHTRHSTVHLCLVFFSNITTSSRSRHHVRHLFKCHHIRWHNSDNKSPLHHRLTKYFIFYNLHQIKCVQVLSTSPHYCTTTSSSR